MQQISESNFWILEKYLVSFRKLTHKFINFYVLKKLPLTLRFLNPLILFQVYIMIFFLLFITIFRKPLVCNNAFVTAS